MYSYPDYLCSSADTLDALLKFFGNILWKEYAPPTPRYNLLFFTQIHEAAFQKILIQGYWQNQQILRLIHTF